MVHVAVVEDFPFSDPHGAAMGPLGWDDIQVYIQNRQRQDPNLAFLIRPWARAAAGSSPFINAVVVEMALADFGVLVATPDFKVNNAWVIIQDDHVWIAGHFQERFPEGVWAAYVGEQALVQSIKAFRLAVDDGMEKVERMLNCFTIVLRQEGLPPAVVNAVSDNCVGVEALSLHPQSLQKILTFRSEDSAKVFEQSTEERHRESLEEAIERWMCLDEADGELHLVSHERCGPDNRAILMVFEFHRA
mmetsp:Transcript_47251/g.110119  ORF Transcript_47251/g.110119 Transcript_47251/m.110119 type:complete len:247 (-) Transcript_47251:85-825(-)